MNPDPEIVAALRALAESDRGKEAGPEVEARLRTAYLRSIERRRRRTLAYLAVVAAIIVIAGISWRTTRVGASRTAAKVEHAAPMVENRSASATPAPNRSQPQPREIMTEFFPLMDAPPPIDHGELVRVSLPAAAMRTVGLPVREDRLSEPVEADVLVSEDGLATAIRFVKTARP